MHRVQILHHHFIAAQRSKMQHKNKKQAAAYDVQADIIFFLCDLVGGAAWMHVRV